MRTVSSEQRSDAPGRTPGFALFESPVGACGVAWGAHGLLGTTLPGASAAGSLVRMQRRFPHLSERPAPEDVRRVIERIERLLQGTPDDLCDVALDMSQVRAFDRRVYAVARLIRPATTRTYGEIATELGEPGAARDVGQALGANPFAIIVPCHRVLAAGGKAGGFSAPGGLRTKLRLLELEGTLLGATPGLFDPPARNGH